MTIPNGGLQMSVFLPSGGGSATNEATQYKKHSEAKLATDI